MKAKNFAEELLAHVGHIESGEQITGTELARMLKRLTELEVEEGGPYALVIGGEVDLGMNLAAARFLAAYNVQLPKLDAYIEKSLRTESKSVLAKEDFDKLSAWYTSRIAEETKDAPALSQQEEKIIACILEMARKRFNKVSYELREEAMQIVERTTQGYSNRQIPFIALSVREALGRNGSLWSDEDVARLGLANIFFWGSSIVYDDFWDKDETAEPRKLPAANLLARHYIDFYSNVVSEGVGFRRFFHRIMDALDGANEWETSQCRAHVADQIFHIPEKLPAYGDFSIKFFPASGHIFGPVSMFLDMGCEVDSPEIEQLVEYFKHYLVAMQMNDDMHDWKDDLMLGHISTSVSVLLEKWQEKYPEKREIHLEKDMPALEKLFWFEAIRPLCDIALEHVAKSRAALHAISILENPAPLERYISRNERIAKEALTEHEKSRDFLRAFA